MGLLAAQDDIEVVGLASEGYEALESVRDRDPDVLLIDLRIPKFDGLFVLQRLQNKGSRTRVILLAESEDRLSFVEALNRGCAGILLKDGETHQIPMAIRKVHSGSKWLDEKILRTVNEDLHSKPATLMSSPFEPRLTLREREIVRLVAEGCTNRQIASFTTIGMQTVRNHLCSIFAKVGVTDRVQLALYALHKGIESFETPRQGKTDAHADGELARETARTA